MYVTTFECLVVYAYVQCTLYSVHCTVYSVQCTVYIVQCTVYIVQCTLYSVQCTLYSVQCILYSVHVYWYVILSVCATPTMCIECVSSFSILVDYPIVGIHPHDIIECMYCYCLFRIACIV